MAKIGREEKGISPFFCSAKPVPCKPKTKSKKKTKSRTSTNNRAVKEPTNLLITKAELSDNAQVNINTKELESVPKPILLPSVGGNPASGKDEGRDGDINLDADPLISTAFDDDTYSPLLRFICEHSFMRDKHYPVSLSSRQQFVRDVHEEAGELGYKEKEVDRVLLDIKRYYLKTVGSAAAFSEGIEFGDEVDDSGPASHKSEVPSSSDQKTFKHKREEALTRADSLVEKRLINTTSLSGRTALTPCDAIDHNDVAEKGKLSKFQRKRKRKRERRQGPDQPLFETHKGARQTPITIDLEYPKVAPLNKTAKPLICGKGKMQEEPRSLSKKKIQRTVGRQSSQSSLEVRDCRHSGAVREDPIVLDF
jgi:hypothetical protein